MSLVMTMDDLFDDDDGIYSNPTKDGIDWERPCSVELFYPDGSDDGFQVNCGVRIYGGVGRNEEFRKKTFRLLFKGMYGPTKLRYPIFGEEAADEFDTIILRASIRSYSERTLTTAIRGASPNLSSSATSGCAGHNRRWGIHRR